MCDWSRLHELDRRSFDSCTLIDAYLSFREFPRVAEKSARADETCGLKSKKSGDSLSIRVGSTYRDDYLLARSIYTNMIGYA